MARPRTYTDDQLAYIKQHWRKYPTKLVAEQLGMTSARVDNIANYHGLRKNLNQSRKPLPEFVIKDGYYEYYHAVAAKHDALALRKNWLQRLVSWFLTGEA